MQHNMLSITQACYRLLSALHFDKQPKGAVW